MRPESFAQSDQSGSLDISGKRYLLDGIISIEQFYELKTQFYTSNLQDFDSQLDLLDSRTHAFDQDFWPQLQKAYTKLRSYQYGREEGLSGDRMIIDNDEEEQRCIAL